MLLAGMFTFSACGPSAEEKVAADKAKQDSVAAAQAQMQAMEDAAKKAAMDTTKMAGDSTKMMADTTAKK